MGTKQRTIGRAAFRAIAALAMMSTLSSCIVMDPWHRDRWDRDSRSHHERRHDDQRNHRMSDPDRGSRDWR